MSIKQTHQLCFVHFFSLVCPLLSLSTWQAFHVSTLRGLFGSLICEVDENWCFLVGRKRKKQRTFHTECAAYKTVKCDKTKQLRQKPTLKESEKIDLSLTPRKQCLRFAIRCFFYIWTKEAKAIKKWLWSFSSSLLVRLRSVDRDSYICSAKNTKRHYILRPGRTTSSERNITHRARRGRTREANEDVEDEALRRR